MFFLCQADSGREPERGLNATRVATVAATRDMPLECYLYAVGGLFLGYIPDLMLHSPAAGVVFC
jgi:hypothetical protein